MDCTAAPLAPLPRLSRRAISRAWVSLANTKISARLLSLQACTSKPPCSSVSGSRSGITRTKASPVYRVTKAACTASAVVPKAARSSGTVTERPL